MTRPAVQQPGLRTRRRVAYARRSIDDRRQTSACAGWIFLRQHELGEDELVRRCSRPMPRPSSTNRSRADRTSPTARCSSVSVVASHCASSGGGMVFNPCRAPRSSTKAPGISPSASRRRLSRTLAVAPRGCPRPRSSRLGRDSCERSQRHCAGGAPTQWRGRQRPAQSARRGSCPRTAPWRADRSGRLLSVARSSPAASPVAQAFDTHTSEIAPPSGGMRGGEVLFRSVQLPQPEFGNPKCQQSDGRRGLGICGCLRVIGANPQPGQRILSCRKHFVAIAGLASPGDPADRQSKVKRARRSGVSRRSCSRASRRYATGSSRLEANRWAATTSASSGSVRTISVGSLSTSSWKSAHSWWSARLRP